MSIKALIQKALQQCAPRTLERTVPPPNECTFSAQCEHDAHITKTSQVVDNLAEMKNRDLSKSDIESAPILTNANTPGSRSLRAKVLRAAMQVCDLWGDGEAARQAMSADIEAAPDEQLPELLVHFDNTYSAFKGLSGGELKKLSKLIHG